MYNPHNTYSPRILPPCHLMTVPDFDDPLGQCLFFLVDNSNEIYVYYFFEKRYICISSHHKPITSIKVIRVMEQHRIIYIDSDGDLYYINYRPGDNLVKSVAIKLSIKDNNGQNIKADTTPYALAVYQKSYKYTLAIKSNNLLYLCRLVEVRSENGNPFVQVESPFNKIEVTVDTRVLGFSKNEPLLFYVSKLIDNNMTFEHVHSYHLNKRAIQDYCPCDIPTVTAISQYNNSYVCLGIEERSIKLQIINVAQNEPVKDLFVVPPNHKSLSFVSWDFDRTHIFYIDIEGNVVLYKRQTKEAIALTDLRCTQIFQSTNALKYAPNEIKGCYAISHEHNLLATYTCQREKNCVSFFNFTTGNNHADSPNLEGEHSIKGLWFIPKTSLLLCLGNKDSYVFDVKTFAKIQQFKIPFENDVQISLSPTGTHVICYNRRTWCLYGCNDNGFVFICSTTGSNHRQLYLCRFSDNGRYFACVGRTLTEQVECEVWSIEENSLSKKASFLMPEVHKNTDILDHMCLHFTGQNILLGYVLLTDSSSKSYCYSIPVQNPHVQLENLCPFRQNGIMSMQPCLPMKESVICQNGRIVYLCADHLHWSVYIKDIFLSPEAPPYFFVGGENEPVPPKIKVSEDGSLLLLRFSNEVLLYDLRRYSQNVSAHYSTRIISELQQATFVPQGHNLILSLPSVPRENVSEYALFKAKNYEDKIKSLILILIVAARRRNRSPQSANVNSCLYSNILPPEIFQVILDMCFRDKY